MSQSAKAKQARATRRARRVRAKIFGTATHPRLSVKRSAKHIYAQLIDDAKGHTLASASDKDVDTKATGTLAVAEEVGKTLGVKAKELGIEQAVFDRGSYRFHGRVAALAKGVKESGIRL